MRRLSLLSATGLILVALGGPSQAQSPQPSYYQPYRPGCATTPGGILPPSTAPTRGRTHRLPARYWRRRKRVVQLTPRRSRAG